MAVIRNLVVKIAADISSLSKWLQTAQKKAEEHLFELYENRHKNDGIFDVAHCGSRSVGSKPIPTVRALTPSLSGYPHLGVDGQGGYSNFDLHTSRGVLAFSPWPEPSYMYALGQINLCYIPISKADTYYSGSTVNITRIQFQYHFGYYNGETAYLAGQYHLSANYSSAVSSVAFNAFVSVGAPVASATVQSVFLPSVPDQISTNSASNPVENPPTSSPKTSYNPTPPTTPPQI